MTYDHLHTTGGVIRRRRSLTVPVAVLSAAALSLAACSDSDDTDGPKFTEQPRTADEASANGTMSVEPSASETDDADAGQWLSDGETVSVGWATAWQGSATPFTYDEGYVYDLAVSNPRVFSETVAANPNAPSDHPDSQASTGEMIACYDLSGKNMQEYERAVFSSGRYNIEIKGTVADHLTAEPATPEDVEQATRDFVLMGNGPSAAIDMVHVRAGGSETQAGGEAKEFKPVGTDSYEQYAESHTTGKYTNDLDRNIVEVHGPEFKVSQCVSLGDQSQAPDSIELTFSDQDYHDGFRPDTDARGWKLDL
ncbi:MAG: hypothetical protein ACTH1D_06795 [Mycobacteriaceae bacterium]|uniref:Putative secreted protein n=1 Tax=Corynebacterium variabile (strain DSM 44702 / CIP 107183 / JCM 12073 / NCIMB 30131) TaxID=858619 RepID=G0HF30_CORVD|nr:hypothetical protein [Corynebacterium variabile]AEK37482.1 putative secreted protein [Corynebacterium variabile DSM 44702]